MWFSSFFWQKQSKKEWKNVKNDEKDITDKKIDLAENNKANKKSNDVKDEENQREELGDVLFSAVNVARLLNIDSEHALYDACDKFTDRFSKVEALAKERNIDMKSAPLSQLDSLWDEVKINQK